MEIGVFDLVERNGQRVPDLYEDRLRLCELYDRTGFYCYHIAEHHSTPHGLAPSPSVLLSSVAQRTVRLRFGALVYLMPFYHPLRLIEEICMLDQISRGRVDVGIGRGISPIERGFYGIEPDQLEERVLEGYEVLRLGLSGNTLDFDGRFYSFRNVPLELGSFQKPHPPIWYPLHSIESAEWAARQGFNMVTVAPTLHARSAAARYADVAMETRPDDALKIGIARKIVVAESDEEALAVARRAYPLFLRNFNHLASQLPVQPKNRARATDFDACMEEGSGIAGSPDTVTRILLDQLTGSRFNYLMCEFIFGDLAFSSAVRSVELFAQHVMPRVTPSC